MVEVRSAQSSRLVTGMAVLLLAVLVVGCFVGSLVRQQVTPIWPYALVVAVVLSASALAELERGRPVAELLGRPAVTRAPRRLAYESAAVLVVGLLLGGLAGRIWQSMSSCLAAAPADELDPCGAFFFVIFGLPILALAGAAILLLLRVTWGWAIAIATMPAAIETITFYRMVTRTGDQDPPIWAVAVLAGAVALVTWVATSPRIPALIRLAAVALGFVPVPVGAVVLGL